MTDTIKNTDNRNLGSAVILYLTTYLIVAVLFLFTLYGSIINRFFEMDLWWMIPSIFYYTEGKTFGEIARFIIGTEPYMLGSPTMKLFLYAVSTFLGPQPKNYIFVLLIVHFLNSALLFFLCRRLQLNVRISFFASLMYLALYAHFESYIWPGNVQHMIVAFFILTVLILYLKTDELIVRGVSYRTYWIAAMAANAFATLSRISILILPAIILVHILVCAGNDKERKRKYDIWLPLFLMYLVYPLLTLVSVGDDQAEVFFAFKSLPSTVSYLILFFMGISTLIFLRIGLRIYPHYREYRLKRIFVPAVLAAFYLFAIAKDVRNLLLPYNVMVPFAGTLNSFFQPLQSVLLLDSTQAGYQIHSQMSPYSYLLSIFFIGIFLMHSTLGLRRSTMLLAWYIIPYLYLNLYSNILSRYIVYITPIFCIVVAAVLVHFYEYVGARISVKSIWKEIGLALIFVALLIPNIVAIKLEMYRHKMSTSFYLYDYIRTAHIIKHDMVEDDEKLRFSAKTVTISNVKPMPYKELWAFCPVDPDRYDNFRFVLMQDLHDIPHNGFMINKEGKNVKPSPSYVVSEYGVMNARGEDIDPFGRLFKEGIKEFKNKRYEASKALFEKAAQKRPFLLNYLLSDDSIEDIIWITNREDLKTWIEKIGMDHSTPSGKTEKSRYIKSIMNYEISIYIESLFYLSYLSCKLGDEEGGKYWFSKISFLEADHEKVFSRLSQLPDIKFDAEAISFLRQWSNPVSFTPSLWYRPNRDRIPTDFQMFLVGFVFSGKINQIVHDKAYAYMKKYRKARVKPHSMPHGL